MQKHPIGRTGLNAAPIMLGGNVFGWTADRTASFAILDAFVDAGGSLIDTADIYSAWVPGNKGGESEEMLGAWLRDRGRRDEVLIATKVGLLDGKGGSGLSASRIAGAVEESLTRLGTDRIDIYFAHKDDESTPLEETLEAFDRLVRSGKVRVLGASNYGAGRLNEALQISKAGGWARFEVIEPRYNLLERAIYEDGLQDLAVREELATVPYYALANGYLAGKYRTESDIAGTPREKWLRPLFDDGRGPKVLAAMDRVAEETGAPLVSIAIAWVIAQPGIAAPIASATHTGQLQSLIAGAKLHLSADHLALLDEAGR